MLRPVLPLFEYIINQDYIAEFLCVNKGNKALHCNGKCYLMKKLAEQKQEKKHNLPKISIEEYPIGFVNILKIQYPPQTAIASRTAITYKNLYRFLYCNSNFRPPNPLG